MQANRFAALAVSCLMLLLTIPTTEAAVDARMLRFPDVSSDEIAFVYAGDIWVVSKAGGVAHRLSTPRGQESFPRFSPDGSSIAFSGNYDGNTDIYVVATSGGIPLRLTHHPYPDRILDWYPDGESILYASPMASGTDRFNQLYRTSKDGGLPDRLPVPYGEFGSIGPDGTTLAYLPLTRDFRTWKRYRGGSTSDIWLFDLDRLTSKNITASATNDTQPMWHGKTLYFLSDRDENQRYNIWALDSATGDARQVTHFETMDVAFPAIGPDEIVFTVGTDLYLLDLQSEKPRKVEVEVVTDRATLKPRQVNVGDDVVGAGISPGGKRVLFQARGEIFSVPAEHGVTRNLTHSPGVAERHPAWSPDGKWIAYFSDRSGEYELTLRAADGSGAERTLSSMGPGFRYEIYWSPDSKKVVFVDQAMRINLFDVEAEKVTPVDQGRYMFHGGLSGFEARWSADSRWVAWSRAANGRNSAIFVYDTKDGKLHQATSGFYSDTSPVFDPDGKYLYLLSNRSFSPSYSDIDNSWIYANTTNLAAIPLREDVASPLAPRNDEEGEKGEEDEKGDKDEGDKKKGKGKDKQDDNGEDEKDGEKETPDPVEIDFDGFESRIVVLPPDAGNYGALDAVAGKVVYRRHPRTGAAGDGDSPILYYDLKEREEKTILGDADGLAISADDKKMLVVQDGTFAIVDVAADQKTDKKVDVSGLSMELDPVAEWRQIFYDAWRLERDYFYDPGMHGVDWDEMRTRYGALLDDVVTRWDLNFVIGELIAELNASHAYRGGGDTEQPERLGAGLLGCDYELHDGAYRIARIIRGAAWDSHRSPLAQPGVEVNEGDYLLAVNGVALDTTKDPWASFAGLADKTVELTVNDKPELEGARKVLVETLSDEYPLRNLAWIEANRKKVAEATDGRVGYIHVPDTSIRGQNSLVRLFQGQYAKDGLIIDERFNSGGQIPDRFIELLNRPLFNYWGVRDGEDWQWPPVSHPGAKAMLINPWSGSGGDLFPWYFKQAGVGPLIGTTTWGGLIGISGAPGLIDGGGVTVPTFGIYSLDGEWIVENKGVEPDILVVDDPALMLDGGDPQLERAIEEVLKALKNDPPPRRNKPAYDDRSGR